MARNSSAGLGQALGDERRRRRRRGRGDIGRQQPAETGGQLFVGRRFEHRLLHVGGIDAEVETEKPVEAALEVLGVAGGKCAVFLDVAALGQKPRQVEQARRRIRRYGDGRQVSTSPVEPGMGLEGMERWIPPGQATTGTRAASNE